MLSTASLPMPILCLRFYGIPAGTNYGSCVRYYHCFPRTLMRLCLLRFLLQTPPVTVWGFAALRGILSTLSVPPCGTRSGGSDAYSPMSGLRGNGLYRSLKRLQILLRYHRIWFPNVAGLLEKDSLKSTSGVLMVLIGIPSILVRCGSRSTSGSRREGGSCGLYGMLLPIKLTTDFVFFSLLTTSAWHVLWARVVLQRIVCFNCVAVPLL